jgi:hypothetical protein
LNIRGKVAGELADRPKFRIENPNFNLSELTIEAAVLGR